MSIFDEFNGYFQVQRLQHHQQQQQQQQQQQIRSFNNNHPNNPNNNNNNNNNEPPMMHIDEDSHNNLMNINTNNNIINNQEFYLNNNRYHSNFYDKYSIERSMKSPSNTPSSSSSTSSSNIDRCSPLTKTTTSTVMTPGGIVGVGSSNSSYNLQPITTSITSSISPPIYKRSKKYIPPPVLSSSSTIVLPMDHHHHQINDNTTQSILRKQQQQQQQQQQHHLFQSLTSTPLQTAQLLNANKFYLNNNNNNSNNNDYPNEQILFPIRPSNMGYLFDNSKISVAAAAAAAAYNNLTSPPPSITPTPSAITFKSVYSNDENKCHVCGDKSTGSHFGGISCESCKAFFRRSVQNDRHLDYKCTYQNSCEMNINTRKICQACRYRSCLSIGMRPKWVLSDTERLQKYGSRRRKLSSVTITSATTTTTTSTINTTITTPTSLVSLPSLLPPPSNSSSLQQSSLNLTQATFQAALASPPPPPLITSPLTTIIPNSTFNSTTTNLLNATGKLKLNDDNNSMNDIISDYDNSLSPKPNDSSTPTTTVKTFQNCLNNLNRKDSYGSNLSYSVSSSGIASSNSSDTNSPLNPGESYYCNEREQWGYNNQTYEDLEAKELLEEEFYKNGIDSINTSTFKILDYDKIVIDKLVYAYYYARQLHPMNMGNLNLQITTLQGLHTSIDPTDLSKTSKIIAANFIRQPVRRLVTFSKLLPDFRNLSVSDQVLLLRTSAIEMIICSSISIFDKNTNQVMNAVSVERKIEAPDKQAVQLNLMKAIWPNEVFEQTIKYLKSMVELKIDEPTLVLYLPLILFSPDRRELVNRKRILEIQTKYSTLLYKFLLRTHKNSHEAQTLYKTLLLKLIELRNLHELHSSILIDVDVEQLDLFPKEIIKSDQEENFKLKCSLKNQQQNSNNDKNNNNNNNNNSDHNNSNNNNNNNNLYVNSNPNSIENCIEMSPSLSTFSTPSTSQTDFE